MALPVHLGKLGINRLMDFKSIPKYCISLKRCEARRITVEQEFKKNDIEFTFFDAVDKHDLIVPEISVKKKDTEAAGILGCALSHVQLITLARDLGLEAVCIFEDDIIFCDDFNDRIKYIESLKNFDFDILALGGHFEKDITYNCAEETIWKYMYRAKRMGGTYGYIIKKNVYNFIIRNYNYNFGADEFYATFVYNRFRSYAMVPFLVGCKPGKSEITEQEHAYPNVSWHYRQSPIPGLTPIK